MAPALVPGSLEAVLFDLFGTLIPTGSQPGRAENLEEMARLLGVEPSNFARRWMDSFDDRARGRLGDAASTIERLARDLGVRPDAIAVDRALTLRLRYVRSLFEEGRSSLAALEALRRAGLRLALVSDTSDDTVRLWPSTEFASRFDATVFSCVEGSRKPDPRMFRLALERLDLPPSACAYVGDGGSHELSGAEASGLRAFQYVFPEDPMGAYRVDLDVGWNGPQLADLLDLLELGRRPV